MDSQCSRDDEPVKAWASRARSSGSPIVRLRGAAISYTAHQYTDEGAQGLVQSSESRDSTTRQVKWRSRRATCRWRERYCLLKEKYVSSCGVFKVRKKRRTTAGRPVGGRSKSVHVLNPVAVRAKRGLTYGTSRTMANIDIERTPCQRQADDRRNGLGKLAEY